MLATEIICLAWPELVPGRLLGYGSFGAVYEAFNNGQPLAVKICSVPKEDEPEPDDVRPEERAAFYCQLTKDYESKILTMQKLEGEPGIVSVGDYRILPQENGEGFYILYQMELLTPLGAYFADHSPTPAETRALGIDLCRALEVCEAKNVIHRDIKPDNIFVDAEGRYKLGDFGVARCLDDLTSAFSRHGTANYMAPEVASAARYDGRADLYSLGLVLYRNLNHMRLPFLGEGRLLSSSERNDALMMRLRGDDLPAPSHAGEAFGKLILKACAFRQEDRFRNAAELREALEALTEEDLAVPASVVPGTDKAAPEGPATRPAAAAQSEAPSPARKKKKALPFILAAGVLIAAAIALLFLLRKPAPAPEESAAESTVRESEADSEDSDPFNEDLSCKVHAYGDWSLVMNHLDVGTEVRRCTVCGASESRRHRHEFEDPITLPSGRVVQYCLRCAELRFGMEEGGKGDPCDHKQYGLFCSLMFSRGQAKIDFPDSEYCTDLEKSFFCGWEYHCQTCGAILVIPHRPSEPVYELQADGTTRVRIYCLSCGYEFTGDSFILEADGHYRSHTQHPVVGDAYTMEGLSAEEAEKYHLIIECSCGETMVKEEHDYENGYGTCVCGKKRPE